MWTFLGFRAFGIGGGNDGEGREQKVAEMLPNFFPAQPCPQPQQTNNVDPNAFWPIQQQNNGMAFFGQPPPQSTEFLVPLPNNPNKQSIQVITIALQYGPLKELVIVERTTDQNAFELFRSESAFQNDLKLILQSKSHSNGGKAVAN